MADERDTPSSSVADVDEKKLPPHSRMRNTFSRRILLALGPLAFFAVCYSASQPSPRTKDIPIRDTHQRLVPLCTQASTGEPIAAVNSPIYRRPSTEADALPLVAPKILQPTHPRPEATEADPNSLRNTVQAPNGPVPTSIPWAPSDGASDKESPPPFVQPNAPRIVWQTVFPAVRWFFLWPFRFAFGITYSLLSTFLFTPLASIFRTVKFFAFTVPYGILAAVSPALTFLSLAALMGAVLGGTAGLMSEGIASLVCGNGTERHDMGGDDDEGHTYYDDGNKTNFRRDNSHDTERAAFSFKGGWESSASDDTFDEDSFYESFACISESEQDVENGSRRERTKKSRKRNLSDRIRAAEKGRRAARKRAEMQRSVSPQNPDTAATQEFLSDGTKARHGRGTSSGTNAEATSTSTKSNRRTPTSVNHDESSSSRLVHPVDSSSLRRNVREVTVRRKHKKFNNSSHISAEL